MSDAHIGEVGEGRLPNLPVESRTVSLAVALLMQRISERTTDYFMDREGHSS